MVVRTTWKPSWTCKDADGDSMRVEEFLSPRNGLGGWGLKQMGQGSEPHHGSWKASLASRKDAQDPRAEQKGPSGVGCSAMQRLRLRGE